jgi:hypothetical protein
MGGTDMKLRDIQKINTVHDGTRLLSESVVIPEVQQAIADWIKNAGTTTSVIIGGIALSYYVKPRATVDFDLLFLSDDDIPMFVEQFKRNRPGSFLHKKTNVEVEVVTPGKINMDNGLAKAIFDHSNLINNTRIASPSGLIASKLKRFSMQDKADIISLYKTQQIDLSKFPLTPHDIEKYNRLIAEHGSD